MLFLFLIFCFIPILHGELTFLSPSLGRALRDCVRLFMGPEEGAGSLATPGENLKFTQKRKSEAAALQKRNLGDIPQCEGLSKHLGEEWPHPVSVFHSAGVDFTGRA